MPSRGDWVPRVSTSPDPIALWECETCCIRVVAYADEPRIMAELDRAILSHKSSCPTPE